MKVMTCWKCGKLPRHWFLCAKCRRAVLEVLRDRIMNQHEPNTTETGMHSLRTRAAL